MRARREANYDVVAEYLSLSEPESIGCFSEDVVKELTFATFNPEWKPCRILGRKALMDAWRANGHRAPKYKWTDCEVFSTQDPDRFWVHTGIEGYIENESGEKVEYSHPDYILFFVVKDQKIVELKQIMNPLRWMKSAGLIGANPETIRFP